MRGGWEEEWELCNDDGFVYKRRKRHHHSQFSSAPDPHNESELLLQRRARKKEVLKKLRERYQREIQQWEGLSTVLQQMQDKIHLASPPPLLSMPESALSATQDEEGKGDGAFRPLVDDLLLQAEAQEAIIQDLSNLCDAAETMCKAQEEQLKLSFIDLPVWESPSSLMASLSEFEDGGCTGND